jgi:hypothetical protein
MITCSKVALLSYKLANYIALCILPTCLSLHIFISTFNIYKKPEYPESTTDHGQATGKLYHLWLRVECTLFVIYKAGHEPTSYMRKVVVGPGGLSELGHCRARGAQ